MIMGQIDRKWPSRGIEITIVFVVINVNPLQLAQSARSSDGMKRCGDSRHQDFDNPVSFDLAYSSPTPLRYAPKLALQANACQHIPHDVRYCKAGLNQASGRGATQ